MRRLYPILSVTAIFIFVVGILVASQAQAYNVEGTETQLTTDLDDQFDPSISGAFAVYTDRRGEDADIYLYDMEEQIEIQITSGVAISSSMTSLGTWLYTQTSVQAMRRSSSTTSTPAKPSTSPTNRLISATLPSAAT